MKVLTICQGAGSRSPGAAQVLNEMGHDTKCAALSLDSPNRHVDTELLDWADLVLVFYGESPGVEIVVTDTNKTDYLRQYSEYIHKTKFIWCYDPWGAPVGDGQLEYFRYFFTEIMIIPKGLASIKLEPCKCGGVARFRFDCHPGEDRLLIECARCGIKSPYVLLDSMDESEQLARGKTIAKIWNNLQTEKGS